MRLLRRVACAISGGVDSAVAALLLKKRGYEVVGVHMVNWDRVEEGVSDCPQTRDEHDARRVCERLQIPLHVISFVDRYWNEIFTHLLNNYRKGRTVVSDVKCNKTIKFDQLHKYAFEKLGVDAVATGHFARTNLGDFLEKQDETTVAKLLVAVDPLKDQTYFLSTLSQEQLRRSMFPVGSLYKCQIRRIAMEAGLLEVADKPEVDFESMGICFIGKKRNFDRFIDEYIEPTSGPVRNIDSGKVIFEHEGIHHYTIGKRIRGLPGRCQSPLGLFAAAIDATTQTLWACEGSHHPALFAREFVVTEPSWTSNSPLTNECPITAEFRCQRTHPALKCRAMRLAENLISVKPYNPVRAAAPGQMCVFYNNDECLGGGEIQYIVSTLAEE